MSLLIKKYLRESFKYLLRSSFVVKKYVSEIDSMYDMTHDELRARNEKRFLEIFRKAYTCSVYYRNLCKDCGVYSIDDIKHLDDIAKLPILTKDMLKEHGKELLTCKEKRLIKNHTSGTTGTPLTVYQDWKSVWREQAYFVCFRKRCGYHYGEPMVSLRGNLTRDEISLKIHVSNTLFLSSYNINPQTAEIYHRLIQKHHPKAIEGYPSSLYSLALVLREKGLECHIPVAFTSSETLFDYQRKVIEQVFHTQVYDHYGTTERTIRLEESLDHSGYYEDPGYGIEEYYDDHIISTSLINDVFPLIRYKTDDRIVLKKGVNKSSQGFIDNAGGIERVVGRTDDILVCKDGSMVTRVDFIEEGEHIKACQWIQNEKGKLEIRIAPDEGFNDKDKEFVIEETLKRCGHGNMDITTKVCSMDEMVYSKRGKFKLIVNNLQQK